MSTKGREWFTPRSVPRVEGRIDPENENYAIVKNALTAVAHGTADGIEDECLESDPVVYMGIWGDDTDKSDPQKIIKEYRSVAKYLEGLGNGFASSLSLRGYMTVMRYLYGEYRGLRFQEDKNSGKFEGDNGKRRLTAKYPDVKGPSVLFDVCNGYGLSIQDMKDQTLRIANQVREENAIYRIFN